MLTKIKLVNVKGIFMLRIFSISLCISIMLNLFVYS